MRHITGKSLKSALFIIVCAAILVALFSGCSRDLGYGLVLWSQDEDQLASGSVVSVASESEIQDNFVITVGEVDLTLPRWRVSFFETQEEAAAAAAQYEDLATVYASAGRNALPMRSSPELEDDNIVYRLRSNEVVKLVWRANETTDLSGLVSHWYRALTDTGVEAYVFGYELSLFDALDPEAEFAQSGSVDPLMQMLLEEVWRPIYFADMIADGAYDLDLFRPEYGFFPNPEERLLTLILPYHTVEFQYEEIANTGPRKYLAEGTNLQITFNRGDELSLQYLYDDRQYILALQRVAGDIQEYVDAELDRRARAYEALLERGPAFSSGNYGRITLLEDGSFIWKGYERLIPAAIPDGLGTEGEIRQDLYLSRDLREEYDGVLSFKFDGAPESVNFLYTLVTDGIRMIYVPPEDIEEYFVTGSGASSIAPVFSAPGT